MQSRNDEEGRKHKGREWLKITGEEQEREECLDAQVKFQDNLRVKPEVISMIGKVAGTGRQNK
jgi:hypothetical protein